MPRHRESIWIETVIAEAFDKLGTIASRPIRNTPFEHWLLDREGQIGTFFFTPIAGSLVWLIFLEYSLRNSSKLAALAASARRAEADAEVDTDDHIAHDDNTSSPSSTGDMPIMKKLAPPGHLPTNAQLNISPFQLSRNLADPPTLAYPTLPKFNETPEDYDFCANDDEASPSSQPQGRNFTRIATEAPTSFGSLRERGMLDRDGTPTRKHRLHQLLGEDGA
ncbi:hypothetical protein HBI84_015250 [Parastagonospora nodorum]|nr:hypothetical protein HBI84_015250 [Parastagonospora nodorum]